LYDIKRFHERTSVKNEKKISKKEREREREKVVCFVVMTGWLVSEGN